MKISDVIFFRLVPFIINLLDCTLITLRSPFVNIIFLNEEFVIYSRESFTLKNSPF